jgi:hypothetical protein
MPVFEPDQYWIGYVPRLLPDDDFRIFTHLLNPGVPLMFRLKKVTFMSEYFRQTVRDDLCVGILASQSAPFMNGTWITA